MIPSPDLENAWGYGAIILFREYKWQGFVIPDPTAPAWADAVAEVRVNAETLTKNLANIGGEPLRPEGVLSGVAVECLMEGNQTGLGAAASALTLLLNHRYFVIDAEVDENGGVTSSIGLLTATTAFEARDQINKRVLPLRMAQALKDLQAARAK